MPAKKPTTKTKKTAETNEFAVIATGGKQYRVAVGESIKIEKIKGDFKKGDTVTFDKVLLVDNGTDTSIGAPYVDGAVVTGTVELIARAPKVMVVKYKQKSRYLKQNGHRQPYFKIGITAIK